jgi:sortase A
MAEAIATVERSSVAPTMGVDWEQVSASTEHLGSNELAMGSAVLFVAGAARRIREQAQSQEDQVPRTNGNGGVQGLQVDDIATPPTSRIHLQPLPPQVLPDVPKVSARPYEAPIHATSTVTTTLTPTTTVPAPAAAPTDFVHAPAESDDAPGPIASAAYADVAQARRLNRRLRLAFTGFGWVRNIGLILVLFAAWQLWGTSIEHAHDQAFLRHEFQAHVQHVKPSRTGPVLIASTVRLPEPAQGSVVAHLQIPAIGVDQYVVEGTGEGDLAKGPGHYIGTAMPGQSGNVAIAGHRTTYGAPFNRLDRLTPGDPVMLTTPSGELLTYVVSQPPVAVSPRDVSILNTFDDNRLTLTTCNPKFSASQRLVVVATLRASVATPVPHKVHVVVGSTGWNISYLPGALMVLVLLVLLGLANGRASAIYGRAGRWLVLTPIWAAVLYFGFVLLTKLLPATL